MRSDISFRKKTDNIIEVWSTYDGFLDISNSIGITQAETGIPKNHMIGKILPVLPVKGTSSKFSLVIEDGNIAMTTRVLTIITDHMRLLEEAAGA